MPNYDLTKVITDYVLITPIWQELVTAMTEQMTEYRKGLTYHEVATFIREKVTAKFEKLYKTEPKTVEGTILECTINAVDWQAISRYIYPLLYNTALVARVTQADSYNTSTELQKEYEDNEIKFFEDNYLKIFSDFFSEIP